jgi:hypothetical protein
MIAYALTEEEEFQRCEKKGLNIGLSGEERATNPHRTFIRQ